MPDHHAGLKTKRYGTTHAGHTVEIEFDKRRIVINEVRLFLDGELVDAKKVFYGDKDLAATASDGTKVEVTIASGMAGELVRAQLKAADGTWVDLQEVEPKP